MGNIALVYCLILLVSTASIVCRGKPSRITSNDDELSCENQGVIMIKIVYRNDAAYCRKEGLACSWKNNTRFSEICSIDGVPQLINKCNGNHKCSHLNSFLNDTKCCNDRSNSPDCRNARSHDIYFDCIPVSDVKILDLDINSNKNLSGRNVIIKTSKSHDHVCHCNVRNSLDSKRFDFYYCSTLHSKNCTTRQTAKGNRNFTLYSDKLTSVRLKTQSTGQPLNVTCSCPSNDQKVTSAVTPQFTSTVDTQNRSTLGSIPTNEEANTGGNNMMIFIASGAGGGLLLIVSLVVIVFVFKKRHPSAKPSSVDTSSAVANRQYLNNEATPRNNDVLDDDGYYNVVGSWKDNSNVPADNGVIDDTYNHIGFAGNMAPVVDDTYNHIDQVMGNSSNRQAKYSVEGDNSCSDGATYAAVVKETNTNVCSEKIVGNEEEEDKTYALVNKNDK